MTGQLLPFDDSAAAASNKIIDEVQTISPQVGKVIIPDHGAFYTDTLICVTQGAINFLQLGVDYKLISKDAEMTARVGRPVANGIQIINHSITSNLLLTYQAVGGREGNNSKLLIDLRKALEEVLTGSIPWGQILNPLSSYPPSEHTHNMVTDLTNMNPLRDSLLELVNALVGKRSLSLAGQHLHTDISRTLDILANQRREINKIATDFNILLQAEEIARVNQDNTNAQDIADEVNTRESQFNNLDTALQQLTSALNTETTARQQGDAALVSGIQTEEANRQSGDSALQASIDNLSTALSQFQANQNSYDARRIGTLAITLDDNLPTGTVEAVGQRISQTTYAELFAVYGHRYAKMTDNTNDGLFRLPDLRGQHLRVNGFVSGLRYSHWSSRSGSTVTQNGGPSGNNPGSRQFDAIRNITGYIEGHEQVESEAGIFTNSSGAFSLSASRAKIFSEVGGGATTYKRATFNASNVVPTDSENVVDNIFVKVGIWYE